MDLTRLRELAGLSRARLAARAGVPDEVARRFEADPDSVLPEQRAALVAVYIAIRERVSLELVDLIVTTAPVAVVRPVPSLALVRGGAHR